MTIFYFLMVFLVAGLVYCVWRLASIFREPRIPRHIYKSSGWIVACYRVVGDSGLTILEEDNVMSKDALGLFSDILNRCTSKMRVLMGKTNPHGYTILIRVTLGEANVGAVSIRVNAGIWAYYTPLAGLPMASIRVLTPKGEEEWLDTTLDCINCSPANILPVRSRPVWVKLPDGWKLHTYSQWARMASGNSPAIQAMTWGQALDCAICTAEMTYHTESGEIPLNQTKKQ